MISRTLYFPFLLVSTGLAVLPPLAMAQDTITVSTDSGCTATHQVEPGQILKVVSQAGIDLRTPRGHGFFIDAGSESWGLEVQVTRVGRTVSLDHIHVSVDELRMRVHAGQPPVLVFDEGGTYTVRTPAYDGRGPGPPCELEFSGRTAPDPLEGRLGPRESFVEVVFDEDSGFDWWDFYKASEELQERGYDVVRSTIGEDGLTYRPSPDGPVRLIPITDRSPMREAQTLEGIADELHWLHFQADPIWLFKLDP